METGLLYALAFGVVIIVLAILLTWLTGRRKRRSREDVNGWGRDGANAATWEGIRQARNIDPDNPD
jgi:hypothetical protein